MSGKETITECVAQHLPFLNRMVKSVTGGDSMSDDVVQQTMLKALTHADQFRLESTLRTWLTSIAMNEVRQVYRCKWRTCSVPLVSENLASDLSAVVESPSAGHQARERDMLIRQAVSRLPDPYRCVVELCDFECLSLKEAAARLHLTVPAIKTRRRRARHKLSPLVAGLRS